MFTLGAEKASPLKQPTASLKPFGSLTSSIVDKALTNYCSFLGVSLTMLALLELSGGQWFKDENSDAIRQLILTSALGQLNVCNNS